ncbi:MAG TPA: putative cytokinetic ring protein SteA [Armatimonadota bacterium]|nr:putative cytokinetic ring protein SteA [Armatimonadota bacterium]HOM80501.1 putative cytokinetic ring protein SteA [Armatimonadota bacterium]HPO71470.1 putative cytokinetic ring protein SteA [Armatimonadota bacterium]
MRLPLARAIRGAARPGRKTKKLIPLLHRGDIAIIDHPDIDIVCANALIDRRVSAVINCAVSLTGRYPAGGPGAILAAGIPLFDSADPDLLERVAPGTVIEIREDGGIYEGGQRIAAARPFTRALLDEALTRARANISVEMEAFVRNTLDYLSEEWTLLFDEQALPELRTRIHGRDVLIVVRGEGYREDLQAILPYVRDKRPVLVGVDGGADALLEMRLRPDIILGDMDSVSDEALRCGAEVIVHGYPRKPGSTEPEDETAHAPGLARTRKLGVPASVLRALGTSEDVAMILMERKGARLIVLVGSHFSLQDFLDKGRKGMSSTFLSRLKVGSILVDAKGVSRLYHRGWRILDIVWLLVGAVTLTLVILSVSDSARAFIDLLAVRLQLWLRHL